MRFQDPSDCTCEACGRTNAIAVSELLRLTATCPDCDASFREVGMSMRAMIDEVATAAHAIEIIVQIEEDQGFEIPELAVEEINPWERLTINDLILVTNRCASPPLAGDAAEQAVTAAIRAQYPSAPERLDYRAPLFEAISRSEDFDYGASYD